MSATTKELVRRDLLNLARERQWYQPIVLDGIPAPCRDPATAESQLHGDGKWNNFIEPLLPPAGNGDPIFLEIGSNAGLNLLRAAELGFGQVIGVEADDGWWRQGQYVVEHHARSRPEVYGRIQCLHGRIGTLPENPMKPLRVRSNCEEIFLRDLPAADVTLLANVLYWLPESHARTLVSELASRSRFAVVVSVNVAASTPGPLSLEEVRACFADGWEEQQVLRREQIQHDPVQRPLFSALYKSRVFA